MLPVLLGGLVAGRYRLDEEIGAGGMGVVWRATDIQLGRVVALKRAHAGGDRSLREAKAAAALHHPNVVTLFDVFVDGSDRWLVMEYLPSRSLAGIVGKPGDAVRPLDPDAVAEIGAQVAGALAAVHAIGTLHRDVKPGNVLVTREGTAKLCDFGISRTDWDDPTLTGAGILGTPAYLAPEVAEGRQPTAASDVFALGATLYYAVEGHSPYGAPASPAEVVRRAARGRVIAPQRAGPLVAVLGAMLSRDPRRRPDAGQVAEAFGRVAADIGSPGADATRTTRAWYPKRPRRRLVTVLGGALAVLVVVTLVVFLARGAGGSRAGTPGAQAPAARTSSTSAPGPAPPGMGDQRTADPCALLDPRALARFGTAKLDPVEDNFNRCDVQITNGGQDIDLSVTFADGDVDPSGGVEQVNGLRIKRLAGASDECTRQIGLPGHTRVDVAAEDASDNSVDGAPFCAVADAGSATAALVLGTAEVPRRAAPFPADSLATVDACGLLDAPALGAAVPGVNATRPAPEFGDWECTWHSTTDNTSVDLDYDRDPPITESDGDLLRLAGRQAVVLDPESDDDYCEVDTVNRHLTGPAGNPVVETVDIEISGDRPRAQKCRIATRLAADLAPKLPGKPG